MLVGLLSSIAGAIKTTILGHVHIGKLNVTKNIGVILKMKILVTGFYRKSSRNPIKKRN